MLRRTVACFAGPRASTDLSSGSSSTCKTLSEYCGLSKPKSYALQALASLAALCCASAEAEPEESTPGIASSNLYSLCLDNTSVRSAIYCTTNMRRTAATVLACFCDMHVSISRDYNMTKPLGLATHLPFSRTLWGFWLSSCHHALSRTVPLDAFIANLHKVLVPRVTSRHGMDSFQFESSCAY